MHDDLSRSPKGIYSVLLILCMILESAQRTPESPTPGEGDEERAVVCGCAAHGTTWGCALFLLPAKHISSSFWHAQECQAGRQAHSVSRINKRQMDLDDWQDSLLARLGIQIVKILQQCHVCEAEDLCSCVVSGQPSYTVYLAQNTH